MLTRLLHASLKRYAPMRLRQWAWDREFRSGQWAHLNELATDSVYAVIQRHLNGGVLLDMGCGVGATARELPLGSFSRYLGVDVSSEAIQQARRLATDREEYTVDAIETFTPPCPCDVILFRESVYYVNHAVSAIARLARALTPEGVVIVRIWNANHHAHVVHELEAFPIIERLSTGDATITLVLQPHHD